MLTERRLCAQGDGALPATQSPSHHQGLPTAPSDWESDHSNLHVLKLKVK